MTKKKTLFVVALALVLLILLGLFMFFNQSKLAEKNDKLSSLKTIEGIKNFEQAYDVKMAIEKGICKTGRIDDNFMNMQALYRKAFDSYLYTSLNIEKYDKVLSENELPIPPYPKERSEALTLSNMPSEYICCLNTINIERLDKDSIKILQSYLDNGNTNIDDELLTLVKETFSNVLSMNMTMFNRFEKPTISFQKGTPVIGVCHYPEFDEEGNFVDAKKNKIRREFVYKLALEMQEEFSQELGFNVLVLAMI